MTATAIRQKLRRYINTASDKKLQAIYTLLEDAIDQPVQWWEDAAMLSEMDKEYKLWKEGKLKAYTLEEVRATAAALKKKQVKK